jgi:CheY-like chemotaxis protein
MKSILFIEDEGALQKLMSTVLAEKGYTPMTALDGEIGAAMAREKKPDVILLDLVLPRKDGFAVLEELKAAEETKHIPVIVLSNLEGIADVERAIASGAAAYLVKANYTPEEVVKKIEEVIQAKVRE